MLRAVAEDLRWDEPDMSGLLFALCGHHSKALEEVNNALAMRIRSLAAATTADQERSCVSEIQALALRAQDLKSRCRSPCAPLPRIGAVFKSLCMHVACQALA